jgi:hypothetical protein
LTQRDAGSPRKAYFGRFGCPYPEYSSTSASMAASINSDAATDADTLEFPDKDIQSVQNVLLFGFPASLCVKCCVE